jgi:hypothetical protein
MYILIGEGGEGCVFIETGGARGEGDGHQNMYSKTHTVLGYSSVLVKSINRTVHNVSKFRVFKNKILDFRRFEFKIQDLISEGYA